MTREQLEHAIRAAGAISGDREVYVVGSQTILGAVPDAHPDLLRSMEVDIAPKNQPHLEALIEGSIGELSPFHQTFGFWVDGVDIEGIVLADGWQERVAVVDNANTHGFRGLCLEPVDCAVSKLAAGDPHRTGLYADTRGPRRAQARQTPRHAHLDEQRGQCHSNEVYCALHEGPMIELA